MDNDNHHARNRGYRGCGSQGQNQFSEHPNLKDLFSHLESTNHKQIVVDLKETEYIDGFGLSVLVNLSRDIYKGGGSLSLTSLNKELKRIFSKTKLDRWFDIYESQEDACKNLKKGKRVQVAVS